MARFSALWARVSRDSVVCAGAAATALLSTANGTDACAANGDNVAPKRTPMPMNALTLATMASFPLRPPRKAKGPTEERRREDQPPAFPPALSMPILPFPFRCDFLNPPLLTLDSRG